MTPIERVKRRAEAARRLNVSIYSPADVLKKEWHRRAFECHPDRNGGDDAAFNEMRIAYEILAGTAADDARLGGAPAGPIRPRRVVSRMPSQTERPVY